MKKKDKVLKDYIESKREELSFVTIKSGASINIGDKSYTTDKELSVPVRVGNLMSDIKKQEEYDGVSINNIIDGIIFVIGVDKEFEYVNEYLNMLHILEFELAPYIVYCINNFDETKIDDSVIYSRSLLNLKEDEKSCFIYASALEKKALDVNADNDEEERKCFMEEAYMYYEKSIDYDDKFPLPYYKLGYYYKLKQQYIRAKLYWTKHQELDEDVSRVEEIRNELEALEMYVQFETGYNYVLDDKPEEGLELLLPLVKDHSGWWNLLFFVGLAYRALNQYDIAETYFENVLKINGEQKEALNELGLCKICRGKYTEAAELFTMLLNISPGNCEVFCNRAVAHLYNKEKDKALEDIQTALKINPNDEVALSIKEEIEK